MKCFSLRINYLTYEYDTQVVPLVGRMYNLEELTLYLSIYNRAKFVDGTQLENDILIHLQQLHTFFFYICTHTHTVHPVLRLSNDYIQRNFTNVRYGQVGCFIDYLGIKGSRCHIFSLPFAFDYLEMIKNNFPNIIFNNVTVLWAFDSVPFKHEFFVRLAQCFPLLKTLMITNFELPLSDPPELEDDNNKSFSIVEYPHLTSLDIKYVHINYVERLLHESKTRLPRLTELQINYDKLQTVTENFTRDATRLNCIKVKRLILDTTIAQPKDFYVYFPLL